MDGPQEYREAVAAMVAAGDMEGAAGAALKIMDLVRDGTYFNWLKPILQRFRDLPLSQRERLAGALLRTWESDATDGWLRNLALDLTAAACGLPDSGSLVAARRTMLEAFGQQDHAWPPWYPEMAEIEIAAGRPLPPDVVAVIRRTAAQPRWCSKSLEGLAAQLRDPVLNVGEVWADRALADLPALPPPWHALLAHAAATTATSFDASWEEADREVFGALDADAARATISSWLALAGRPRSLPLEGWDLHDGEYDPYNANALRGLAWLLSFLPPHPGTPRVLGALVETSLRKVPGLGPRSPKVANAGVQALSRLEGEAALAELARLAAGVTHKGTLKLLDKALQEHAAAMGLTREEIEELAVPGYGLAEGGRAVREFGAAGTAELLVRGPRTELTWRNGAGKVARSVPSAIRREHPGELKDLKAAASDIDKMLSAQSARLDRQFLARRSWAYATWRERYLGHPLVGTLARRLLWRIDGEACGYADGALRTLADVPVTGGSTVELWHPAGRQPAEVLAWRDWLERHGVTQPFKQAHREVYLLTGAERGTGSYSNRFAAHILRQHQFHSLTASRGWRNKLRVYADASFPPATRELPQWGLRAEFWITGLNDHHHADLADSGAYRWLRTDQVRFYPVTAPQNSVNEAFPGPYEMPAVPGQDPVQPVPLSDIPELVLSEVLRDVDLFVGVASIGNDPAWQDGGPDGRFRQYWAEYGLGELNQTAETRRELLSRLLPRLAIGGQCAIDGRYLNVKGARHTYKIHLGSSNILMSPGDRYLCIVPRPGPGPEAGYLPFEGDPTLSVILSKAMLLARDSEITDPDILSQL